MIATITPLLAVVLFLLATFTAFLYLKSEESSREMQSLTRESDFALQRITALLHQRQEDMSRLAHQVTTKNADASLAAVAQEIIAQHPEVQSITWINTSGITQDSVTASDFEAQPWHTPQAQWPEARIEDLASNPWSVQEYAPVHSLTRSKQPSTQTVLQLATATKGPGRTAPVTGWLLMEISPTALLRVITLTEGLPPGYRMTLLSANQQVISDQDMQPAKTSWIALLTHDWIPPAQLRLPIHPFGGQLQLHARTYRTDSGLTDRAFLGLVIILGATTLFMLVINWRLSRRRFQTQRQLQEESSFRRAIEDAMISGIRVLDMQGRTTYVNETFSRMVGWSQKEMEGMGPPYPYWPEEDRAVLLQRFSSEIAGNHYPGGLQLRMKRKNGTLFDARIFITPLLNKNKQQTGWLSTINDITEPNKIRQQLASAQDRITLVLEALDASITVAPLGSRELLFANRLYRQWFGLQSDGHLKLIARAGALQVRQAEAADEDEDGLMGLPHEGITSAGAEHAEIYVERLDKWLEVRSRYLDWVDGRLAQMVIATDITTRKLAEEQAARQAEQVQNVSRLVTMGEMASSVAHELNQPLAAISNYTGGMISRIKAQTISMEELIPPLEKTAHQAVRAGQVILRIREFVKRSAPKREHCEVGRIVSEAVEIASIELRKRDVRLSIQLAPKLPALLADAILIEQVLINLLKNAAEAMDGFGTQAEKRQVDLRVSAANNGIRFAISDHGPGVPQDQIAHLFDAFYSTKNDGLGIGLNLCRSIVESHQGKIEVRNLYNDDALTGCEFSFWLPGAAPI